MHTLGVLLICALAGLAWWAFEWAGALSAYRYNGWGYRVTGVVLLVLMIATVRNL